ncbi:MAG: AEC family transporter [Dermatophilaceae bacterium]
MSVVLDAVVPVVMLLGLGWVLRRRFLPDPAVWRGVEWLGYRLFTPALFVGAIAATDLDAVPAGPLLVSLVTPVLVVTAVVVGVWRAIGADGPRVTSLLQGSIRLNTYIGLLLASALYGDDGVAAFALASAIMVPLVNFVSVVALARYGDGEPGRPRLRLWRELLTNPFLQGCGTGLALNLLAVDLPGPVAAWLGQLAAPAVACGTLVAGAALTFRVRVRDALDIGVVTVVKLAVLPLAAAGIAAALGATGAVLGAVVIVCALPSAPSAFVLAGRMGGDTRLMASITGIQTVLAIVTVPLVIRVTVGL